MRSTIRGNRFRSEASNRKERVRTVIDQNMISRMYDCQVVDSHGEKIGSVKQVWLDGRTGTPAWVSVHTGLFGMKETFVPLQRAELHDDKVQVPVAKEQVKDAPHIETTGDRMSESDEAALYRYYGFGGQAGPPPGEQMRGQPGPGRGQRTGQLQDRAGQHPGDRQDAAGQSMTRSEERLKVGTEQVETGKVRLVKHVVTEEQQISVPVSHEEARVRREPITDAAPGETRIGEGEQEISLHAERAVVNKETVPVERVRLEKETVTDEETVSGKVRKEQIEIDDPSGRMTGEDRVRRPGEAPR
jgi:uncharacterized protein (TIGR02271 family)